jgi:predicted DNA-binding transcriptional regulator AlpA
VIRPYVFPSVSRWDSVEDRLIDINDLAQRLKIPAKTIRNKLSNGTWPIRPVRIGRALRWRETDVARLIANLAGDPDKAA